ncbi:MAG: HD-GYP domain-containing protein [Planctomycetota bacterium]
MVLFAEEKANRKPEYDVAALSDGQSRILVGWRRHGRYLIAAAFVDCQNIDILQRLAKGWLNVQVALEKSDSRNTILERLTEELSRGYEELAVTRQFATKQVELDASNDVGLLADETLPDLLRSIRADAAALVRTSPDGRTFVASRCGKDSITDDQFIECIDRYGPESFDSPFVRNRPIEGIDSIHGFAIVCIRKGGEVFGWLIAVNPVHRIVGDGTAVLSEQELGSFETTLMGSAASFFSSHVKNSELVSQLEQQLTSIVRALVSAVDAKDPYTRGHSERVAEFARVIGGELGLSESEQAELHFTGLLHDIGKIGIPDAILRKEGHLTDAEYDVIKTHPTIGWEIVRDVEELGYAKSGIMHHHENYDGSGYPHQLSGEDIPLYGRIIAVADSFDAMTSDRSYRKGRSASEVIKILSDGAGTQWDPAIVKAFQAALPQIEKAAQFTAV